MISRILTSITTILFPSYCFICKKEGGALCSTCLSQRKKVFDTPSPSITSIYSYRDPYIKKIIHSIKYFHRKDLIAPLVTELSHEILSHSPQPDVLVPIPMPYLRKVMRGYNHAEALAQCISLQTNIPVRSEILIRARSKKRQVTTHSRRERLQNQHNAFTVQQNVEGLHIILIDDVSTTGATLLEARRVLIEQGAASVSAYTIAH